MNETPFFIGSMWLPPSVNGSYQIIKASNGHATIGATPELEQFKEAAALTLTRATCDQAALQTILAAKAKHKHIPLAVHLDAYFSTMWKRDLDGVFKAAIDAAFTSLGLNDNLMVRFSSDKLVDASNPRVEIFIALIR